MTKEELYKLEQKEYRELDKKYNISHEYVTEKEFIKRKYDILKSNNNCMYRLIRGFAYATDFQDVESILPNNWNRCVIDVWDGEEYGFPKIVKEDCYDIEKWLIDNGYPEEILKYNKQRGQSCGNSKYITKVDYDNTGCSMLHMLYNH